MTTIEIRINEHGIECLTPLFFFPPRLVIHVVNESDGEVYEEATYVKPTDVAC